MANGVHRKTNCKTATLIAGDTRKGGVQRGGVSRKKRKYAYFTTPILNEFLVALPSHRKLRVYINIIIHKRSDVRVGHAPIYVMPGHTDPTEAW